LLRAHCIHHLLAHRQTGAQSCGRARHASAFAAALGHSFGHLELHVIVQVADRGHAAAFVNRLLDFLRQRDVFDDEAADLDAYLLVTAG